MAFDPRSPETRKLLRDRWRTAIRTDLLDQGVAGDQIDDMIAALESILDETIERLKAAGIPCPVEGCPGDGRYTPPGRGHHCTFEEYIGG